MSTLLRTQIREDHLTCSICLNNFIKPKALPCLHTYCELCLHDYVVSRGYESDGCFPCPTCRRDTTMPTSGVEGFPDNHLMSSLSDTVEKASPMRPVPKPRRSLGPTLPQKQDYNDENVACGGKQQQFKEDVEPPPYSSVADTNPDLGLGDSCMAKSCTNDSSPEWLVVPRQSPSAPVTHNNEKTKDLGLDEFVVVSEPGQPGKGVPSSHINPNETPGLHINSDIQPVKPPSYYPPGETFYPNIAGIPANLGNVVSPIGWNLNAIDGNHLGLPMTRVPIVHDINNDNHSHIYGNQPNDNHTFSNMPSRTSPLLYPQIPPNIEHTSVACTKNLMLKFGKQGSANRDFLKPIGLAVSQGGHYIVSDNGGDQNRIFIFNSGGELTTAFKCGCKVKDITVTKRDEILATVHKNIAAIRHFTMAGQCKAEYGKFFTFEEPCGIAELNNGGVALTGTQNHCVYVLTNQMKLSVKFGRKGNGDGYFSHPGFTAVDSKDHIIVTDKLNNSVQVFGSDGKFKHRFGSTGNNHGNLLAPMGVCVDDDDNIIVADSGNFRVEAFSSKGRYLSTVVKNTSELGENVKPVNVAVTPTGKIAVLLRGPYFAEVRVYSSNHKQKDHHEGIVSTASAFLFPK